MFNACVIHVKCVNVKAHFKLTNDSVSQLCLLRKVSAAITLIKR